MHVIVTQFLLEVTHCRGHVHHGESNEPRVSSADAPPSGRGNS